MDIKDIRYFVAIAEGRSMSRAARDLFVSQPALSLVVKKLENELNAKLFIRKGNSLALTLAGEHLLKTGKRLLAEHDSLVTDLKSLSSGKQEVIRFGISSFYSRLYIPDLFLYYEKNLPSVKIIPIETGSSHLEQKVIDGELEFCFEPELPRNEKLAYRTINIEEFLLAIPKDHPVNHYAIASSALPYMDFRRVMHLPFIMHSKGAKSFVMYERLFKHFDFTPNIIYETAFRETMYALTGSGIGISILPEAMLSFNQTPKTPNFYHIAEFDMTRNYSVAYRPGKKFTPSEEHLIDTLTQLMTKTKYYDRA